MRLTELKIANFRGYRDEVVVGVDRLTALIGRNDSGKSTVLDALEVALSDRKLDASDVCVFAQDGDKVRIECAFEDLPSELTLDDSSRTNLEDEYLLDVDGRLRLRWTWTVKLVEGGRSAAKPEVHAIARAPLGEGIAGLHEKQIKDLKDLVEEAGVGDQCNRSNKPSMRKALWAQAEREGRLELAETEVDLAKEDGKKIYTQIRNYLPLFVVFRADRPSTDQDAEVQDPMKLAVRAALQELADDIADIKARVRERSIEVAQRTLHKLQDFDERLSRSLEPTFDDPKLETAFKLRLLGDDGIAVNKRGSGVRRLVLFSFFRAEAERQREAAGNRSVVYAVEEPETAQHPDFQQRVVETLVELSQEEGSQVILTTHVPGLAGLLPVENLRLVERPDEGATTVQAGSDEVYKRITETLGVVPDQRVRVLLFLEGPTDLYCLRHFCRIYRTAYPELVCLENDPRIAVVLLGGGNLKTWVNEHLLANTGIPEYHIYDRDPPRPDGTYQYGSHVEAVNARPGRDSARLTTRRELENYLHPNAIERVLSPVVGKRIRVEFDAHHDVEKEVGRQIADGNRGPAKIVQRRNLKSWLAEDVAATMTLPELEEADPDEEILGWLRELTALAGNPAPGISP